MMNGSLDTDAYNDLRLFSSDSYIEEVFKKKCAEDTKLAWVFVEWQVSKGYYTECTNLLFMDNENISRHDKSHSVAILDAISMLLGRDKIQQLGVSDLWLILHTTYSHDIGMGTSYEEMCDFWCGKHDADKYKSFQEFFQQCLSGVNGGELEEAAKFINEVGKRLYKERGGSVKVEKCWPIKVRRMSGLLMTDFLRRHHAERSMNMISQIHNGHAESHNPHDTLQYCANVKSRFYNLIAQINYSHSQDLEKVLKEFEYHTLGFAEDYFHPKFAAMMLNIGDLLDIDNSRFDEAVLHHYGPLPPTSQLHRMKHQSIEHMCIKPSAIEIVSNSEDIKVCRLTGEWFRYLKKAVQLLIENWNEIMPKELKGCPMKMPRLEIKYAGNDYETMDKRKFEVNQETLMDLVIGDSIYTERLTFLREYIQNALDASKVSLWTELMDGTGEYLLREKARGKEYRKLTPFDLSKAAYDKYKIEVTLELDKKKENVYLTIKDRGSRAGRREYKGDLACRGGMESPD